MQVVQRRQERVAGALHRHVAVADPVFGLQVLVRPEHAELPVLGLHHALVAPRDGLRGLLAHAARLAVEMQFLLQPLRHRGGRFRHRVRQRDLQLLDLRLAGRNLQRRRAVVQQHAGHAEQQPEYRAPQPDPAVHLAQPLDEGRAARALAARGQFVVVQRAARRVQHGDAGARHARLGRVDRFGRVHAKVSIRSKQRAARRSAHRPVSMKMRMDIIT